MHLGCNQVSCWLRVGAGGKSNMRNACKSGIKTASCPLSHLLSFLRFFLVTLHVSQLPQSDPAPSPSLLSVPAGLCGIFLESLILLSWSFLHFDIFDLPQLKDHHIPYVYSFGFHFFIRVPNSERYLRLVHHFDIHKRLASASNP